MAVLQGELEEMKRAIRALIELQSASQAPMDAQDSTVGGIRTVQAPPKLSSSARQLAMQAITHLIAATTAVHAATLADTFLP